MNRRWKDNRPHFVYVIEAITGQVKVGISNNVDERLEAIRSHSPVAVNLFNCKQFENKDTALAVEKMCHTAMQATRNHHEWFDIKAVTAWTTVNLMAERVKMSKSHKPKKVSRKNRRLRSFRKGYARSQFDVDLLSLDLAA